MQRPTPQPSIIAKAPGDHRSLLSVFGVWTVVGAAYRHSQLHHKNVDRYLSVTEPHLVVPRPACTLEGGRFLQYLWPPLHYPLLVAGVCVRDGIGYHIPRTAPIPHCRFKCRWYCRHGGWVVRFQGSPCKHTPTRENRWSQPLCHHLQCHHGYCCTPTLRGSRLLGWLSQLCR